MPIESTPNCQHASDARRKRTILIDEDLKYIIALTDIFFYYS